METAHIVECILQEALILQPNKRAFNSTLLRLVQVCKAWHSACGHVLQFMREHRFSAHKTRVLYYYYVAPKRWRRALHCFVKQRARSDHRRECARLAAAYAHFASKFHACLYAGSYASDAETSYLEAVREVVAATQEYQRGAQIYQPMADVAQWVETVTRMATAFTRFRGLRKAYLQVDRTHAEARWNVYSFAAENSIFPILNKISFEDIAMMAKKNARHETEDDLDWLARETMQIFYMRNDPCLRFMSYTRWRTVVPRKIAKQYNEMSHAGCAASHIIYLREIDRKRLTS